MDARLKPRLVGAAEAASYLGISVGHLRTAAGGIDGPPAPVRIGHRALWDLAAIDRWLDARAGLAAQSQSKRLGEREWTAR
jgi:hypothetical protein